MLQDHEKLFDFLLEKSNELTKAISSKEHLLKDCSEEVKLLVQDGNKEARKRNYKEAVDLFNKAMKIDPKFIAARTRIMKAYRADGRDLEAIGIGAVAFHLSKEPAVRCQIMDLMGLISRDIFELTKLQSHIEQALSFYSRGIREDKKDIGVRWNYICGAIAGAMDADGISEEDKEKFLNLAKHEQIDLVKVLRKGVPDGKYYIDNIISQAKDNFPKINIWWRGQLVELEEIRDFGEWIEEDSIYDEEKSKNKSKIRNMVLAITMMGALVGGGYSLDAEDSTKTKNETNGEFAIQLPNYHKFFEIKNFNNEAELVEIDRDWDKLAEIERDWDKLAEIDRDWKKYS